jgi:hypothetical protein
MWLDAASGLFKLLDQERLGKEHPIHCCRAGMCIPDPDFSIPDPDFSIPDPDFSVRNPDFSILDSDSSILDPDSSIPDPDFFIQDSDIFNPNPVPGSKRCGIPGPQTKLTKSLGIFFLNNCYLTFGNMI